MSTNQALIKAPDLQTQGNGNGLALSSSVAHKNLAEVPALTDEIVTEILAGRGLLGWLRAARVARVLGLFSLYLFLDTYDVRANFNRRTLARLREQAREGGLVAQIKWWGRDLVFSLLDRFIRVLRFLIFRGAEGSSRKETRLEQQAVWLRKSLIDLGP